MKQYEFKAFVIVDVEDHESESDANAKAETNLPLLEDLSLGLRVSLDDGVGEEVTE